MNVLEYVSCINEKNV